MDDTEEAQAWIEAVTHDPFDDSLSFLANLKTGVRLCKLINAIKPGSVKKVSESTMAFRQIDNINMFLKGCQAMGMPASDCFGAKKLFDEGDCRKEVLNTLESLGGLCQAQGVAVPVFGKNKYATKNTRVWTDEQKLRQARADRGSMLMQGSSGTMERVGESSSGITFGNSAAGAGVGGMTLLSAGSADTMERVAGSQRGITFGNAAAGAGVGGDGTLLNVGSAGTMERVQGRKAGITFGNEAAGAGSGGGGTLVNAGSAATMERVQGRKAGIMFGNEAAGAGSGGGTTLVNAGSAATMERSNVGKAGITFGNEAAGTGTGGDGTLLNAGSAATMERVTKLAAGITFGNEAAGAPPPPPP